ncbi:hypothetical protein HZC34_07675 [Candidatus Saganbacteria bacterium]|nr:hypothetical protein [Candidatus Saganbacteria bacterium]
MLSDIIKVVKRFLLLLIFISIATTAFAEEEIPVNIKAEKLKYIEGTSIIRAEGSVEVKLDRVTIRADSLIMDTKTNIVTAEGNVLMSGLDYDAQCASMLYLVSQETASYKGFQSIVSPSNVRGSLYLKADEINDLRNKMTGQEGKVTTCDKSDPHYFSASKRVEYYPEDKIIGYSNTLYIMDIPVFWLPFLVYDLHGKRDRNWSFGHNDVEGDFIKTTWGYPHGQIFLDEMQKKSSGQGFTYDYNNQNNNGSLYLYHVEEADAGLTDWVAKINHNIGINDKTKLGLAFALNNMYQIPAGRLSQTSYSINLNHTGTGTTDANFSSTMNVFDNRAGNQEHLDFSVNRSLSSANTSYGFNLDQSKGDGRYIRNTQRLSHSQQLPLGNTRLNFNAAYYRAIQNAGIYGDELFEPNIEIINSGSFYNLRLYENAHIDLDRNLYTGDSNDQYLETQPEITLNLNPVDLKLVSLSSSLNYGWFHEIHYASGINANRDYSTGRYKAAINANKSIPLGLGTTFRLGAGLDQFLYDPGDAMNAFREDAGLSTQGYDFMRNDLSYSRGISDGNSPFFFDKFSTKYHNIRDTLVFYYGNYWNWTNSCGYNYETNKYFNYDSSMMIRPLNAVNMNFVSGFDIENQKYLDLSSNIRLLPWDKFSTNLSFVNDLNFGGIKYGNMLLELETADEKDWGNHWKFKYGYVYEPASKELKLRDIMIAKDLHCWEISYTYSDYRKEIAMMFTLKAFPGDPIGYKTGRGFYFDTFDKALKEQTQMESPKR